MFISELRVTNCVCVYIKLVYCGWVGVYVIDYVCVMIHAPRGRFGVV